MRSALAIAVVAIATTLVVASCNPGGSAAVAFKVSNRNQLIGGDRALGDVGDFMVENDKARIVIQGPGFSRGFGIYGGSLIDADLRRPDETGTSGMPKGNDQFGELFPDFFVEAVKVDRVFVEHDGKDGGAASVVAEGDAGDFLELAALLNRAVTGSNVDFQSLTSAPQIHYRTTYEMQPGQAWVKLRFKVENISDKALKFPSDLAEQLLGVAGLATSGFTVPVGDIALFGATSTVWMPGIGYDSRFGLEDSYLKNIPFPAFPGVVVEYMASHGDGASYGIVVDPSDRNFVWNKRAIYDDGSAPIDKTSMLVPFSASSFLGVFHDAAPLELAAGASFETGKYFVFGTGDVGSVLDNIHVLRNVAVGSFGGRVNDTVTGTPSVGTQVLVYQRRTNGRRIFAQYDVRADGSFGGTLEPGPYSLRVQGDARPLGKLRDFAIVAGQTTAVTLSSSAPGRIVVHVSDPEGHALPAKATAIGYYGPENVGKLTRQFLFDLQAGEAFRKSDLVDDNPDDVNTRQYIERAGFTDKNGIAELLVKPGTYRIVTSRGPEYDLQDTVVAVESNATTSVEHKLTRVVDTRGWIAGDMHVHSRNSIDSKMTLDQRVLALAAEGVEFAVATDHNFITDYQPYVVQNDLLPWLFPMTGVEMTTLESGHFNGYPLRYEIGPVTHGVFAWAGRPPGDIFEDMRGLGSLGRDRTMIQVNHPRDGVLGYFAQYARDPWSAGQTSPHLIQQVIAAKGPAFVNADGSTAFSDNFEALEVANGKLFKELHDYRVPPSLPPGDLPSGIPATGKILRAASGLPGFPGVVEDWFNFLNTGKTYIAVGTGDSHDPEDEAGQFRTMIYVGDDRPETLSEDRIVDAMRGRRVVATNGPLVDFYVDDPTSGAMGKTIRASKADHVSMVYRLDAAPWMSISHINVWRNGIIAARISVDPTRDLAHNPVRASVDLPLAKDTAGTPIDSWFVLEAIGEKSMFPVTTPLEVPPVLVTQAVAVLAGPLGIGSDEFGALRPPESCPATSYAITNPVWVTTTSNGFQPPGVVPMDVLDTPANDPKMQQYVYPKSTVKLKTSAPLNAASTTTQRYEPRGRVPLFYPRPDNPFDVRKALSRFGHLNGHK